MKKMFTLLAVALSVFLIGCAAQSTLPSSPTPLSGDRPIPRDIVVTAARFEPQVNLDLVLRSKSEVAGAGAARGALEGAGALAKLAGSCGDALCGAAFLILLPVFTGVGAVVGSVRDAPYAATADTIRSGRASIEEGLAILDLQRSEQHAIAQELLDRKVAASVVEELTAEPATAEESLSYANFSPQAQGAILEISVIGFEFKKDVQIDKRRLTYHLSMKTRARLLAPTTRTRLDEMSYVHESQPHTAVEWLSDRAELFKTSLADAMRITASAIVHEMFLIFYPTQAMGQPPAEKELVPEFVLRPVYPLPVISYLPRGLFSKKRMVTFTGLTFVPIDSLQPTLQWEAFPRSFDVTEIGGDASRLSDVYYELEVYRQWDQNSTAEERQSPLFRHVELAETAYRFDTPLEPCRRYYWRVRAHFRLDEWPRVTEWMGAYNAFPRSRPWVYRRWDKTGLIADLANIDPILYIMPFEAPSADGKGCD